MRDVLIGSERIATTFRGTQDHVRNLSTPRSERIETTSGTYQDHVPNVSRPRSEPIDTTFGTYRHHVRNVSQPRSEPIDTTFGTYRHHVRNVSQPRPERITTTSERIRIRSEPTIPLKSRSLDVGVSGLIIRQKGVDMLPVASSVKGRKVRIRARVRLPNRYPVWW